MSSFIFPPGLSLASLFSRHFYGLKLWKEERVSVLFILFCSSPVLPWADVLVARHNCRGDSLRKRHSCGNDQISLCCHDLPCGQEVEGPRESSLSRSAAFETVAKCSELLFA